MSEPTLFELIQGNATAIGQLQEIMSKMETVTDLLDRACNACMCKSHELRFLREALKPNPN